MAKTTRTDEKVQNRPKSGGYQFAGLPRLLFVVVGGGQTDRASSQAHLIHGRLQRRGWPVQLLTVVSASSVLRLIRRTSKVDLVHIFMSSSGGRGCQGALAVIVALFFGKKVMVTIPEDLMGTALLWRWLYRPAMRQATRVFVSANEAVVRYRKEGLMVEKTRPVIDADLYGARRIQQVQPCMLAVCDLEPGSNISTLTRAFRLVKQKYPRSELVVVGDGSRRREIEQTVNKDRLYGVEFAGWLTIPELREQYCQADLYVNLGSDGDWQMDMVRAFASGLPVLSAEASDVVEMLHPISSGQLFDAGDHSGLADRIIALIEAPDATERLSAHSRSEAEKYAWDNQSEGWKCRYQRAVAR